MVNLIPIRSVSFDASFLLKNNSLVDQVIRVIVRDGIPCFLTSTVVSELEQLKIWGRITPEENKQAIKRWKNAHATLIDFKNRLLSNAFGKACMHSMEKHHGIKPTDIANDCSIIVSALKNGVDLFLSEDFHFTSKITIEVIKEITSAACSEYHMMCDSMLYSVDTNTFLEAYNKRHIDLDIVQARMKMVRKKGKRLGQDLS